MYRNEEEIKLSLNSFYDSMVEVAKEDNVISEDERKILVAIQEGIENLEEQLIHVLQSELEEEEFIDLENQILQDIVFNVTQVAKEDQVITEEESALITKLKDFAEKGVSR